MEALLARAAPACPVSIGLMWLVERLGRPLEGSEGRVVVCARRVA